MGLNVYPNPIESQINIDISSAENTHYHWQIFDLTGRLVMTGLGDISHGNATVTIDATALDKGLYVLNIMINNQMQSLRISKM